MAASTRGISGCNATTSLLAAWMTITASGAFARCCWYSRLRSTVRRTSKPAAASRSNSPFFPPAPPASATVLTSCPGNWSRSARGTHSSSSTRIGDQVLFRLLERRDRQLPRNGWEVVEKLLQRVAAFQVVDQGLHRDSRADEYWRTTQNLGVRVNDGRRFHCGSLAIAQ